jgi:hypothetical protein
MRVTSWATKFELSFLMGEVGLQNTLVTLEPASSAAKWAIGRGECQHNRLLALSKFKILEENAPITPADRKLFNCSFFLLANEFSDAVLTVRVMLL